MPRIKQCADRYAVEDFRKEVRTRQGERDLMSKSALAEEVDMPRTTLSKRLSDPMGMTFGEFKKLNKTIHPNPGVVLVLLGYSGKEINAFRKQGATESEARMVDG